MQNQGIDEKLLSDEELLKRRKKVRNLSILSGFITAIFLIVIVNLALKTDQFLMLIGAAFIPLSILPLRIAYKRTDKEIKARGLD
ncbi:hypothetical protein [Sphingobacterium chungjuense]|uniref:hypothetical protein n=1 Tax=Sphingobacterium chungjuense TaxID=2675553 RepID=UPI001408B741|nr:hypothetical protein [Sphingobacterium chungjuense]